MPIKLIVIEGGSMIEMDGIETPEWEMGKEQFEKTISEARDFIREKRQLVEDAENQLQGTK